MDGEINIAQKVEKTQVCRVCGEIKSCDEMYHWPCKHGGKLNRNIGTCKICQKKKRRNYYNNNKEQIISYNHQRYKDQKEEILEKQKEYNNKHKEQINKKK